MDWVSVIVVFAAMLALGLGFRLKGSARGGRSEAGGWICTLCGRVGEQKRMTRGGWLAEVFVWGSAVVGIMLTLLFVLETWPKSGVA